MVGFQEIAESLVKENVFHCRLASKALIQMSFGFCFDFAGAACHGFGRVDLVENFAGAECQDKTNPHQFHKFPICADSD
jgi:hypothetical protein